MTEQERLAIRSMKAGDLKHRVELLRPSSRVDESGHTITEFNPVVAVKAGMADVSSSDFYSAYAAKALDTITFKTRWRSDVTTKWRIRHRGEVYEILQVNHLGYKRDYMFIKARLLSSEKGAT